MKSSDIHIRTILQQMPQPSITKIRLKITYLKFHSNFPGVNELRNRWHHSYGMPPNIISWYWPRNLCYLRSVKMYSHIYAVRHQCRYLIAFIHLGLVTHIHIKYRTKFYRYFQMFMYLTGNRILRVQLTICCHWSWLSVGAQLATNLYLK